MSPKIKSLDFQHSLDRYRFLMILNAANKNEEYQFAKQATMLWLVNYPGDLYVQYYQAMTYAHLGKLQQAKLLFEGLIEHDPFFIEPLQAMVELTSEPDLNAHYRHIYEYLTQKHAPDNQVNNWLKPMWEARQAYINNDFSNATVLIHQALIEDPPSPLPAIVHLKTAFKMENQEMLNNLSEIYYQQWPKCLQINIIKALSEMDLGKESEAVERLHWVAAHDSAGQVIERLMGTEHRFRDLWPDHLEIFFDLPIPASVSSELGWNQLQTGPMNSPEFKQATDENSSLNESHTEATQKIRVDESISLDINTIDKSIAPETNNQTFSDKNWATHDDFEEIQNAFSTIAKRLKKPDLERADNRFPVYVIATSKKQLETVYGPNTALIIDDLLKNLVSLIQKLPDWNALLFYPDDPAQMSQLGLKPTLATDPWQVKLALSDLDESLAKRGEMIGALLIAGGPEIVPFHHLPNPTYDNDLDVPSDNPYGTIDENYFIPQWPVGRLPGEMGTDAGLLLHQIRELIHQYEQRSKKVKLGSFNFASLINWAMHLFNSFKSGFDHQEKLGYSAEVWKEASAGVYKAVGKPKDLVLSPPTQFRTLALNNKQALKLGYFNLHGVKDGPHWYGQKDFSSESSGPDYPIALSPDMFSEEIPSPKLVLSEACYGANVHRKQLEEALSLKLLDSGTTSFIGSTCIAYGSVTPPLIAADYLAENFWQHVLQGEPAGYALMQAKLSLAKEMTRLQGFLDGEDQKTILSFVLFGDPLAVHDGLHTMPTPLFRFKTHPAVRTISDSDLNATDANSKLPKNINKEVKNVVEKYLPGLENARMQINKSGSDVIDKTGNSPDPERYMVTLQKSFEENQHTTHHHYARMTFNNKGILIKFTTSR